MYLDRLVKKQRGVHISSGYTYEDSDVLFLTG